MANILGSFYTAEDSNAYLARRRRILPQNYVEGRIPSTDTEPEVVEPVEDPLIPIKQEDNLGATNVVQDDFIDLTTNCSVTSVSEANLNNSSQSQISQMPPSGANSNQRVFDGDVDGNSGSDVDDGVAHEAEISLSEANSNQSISDGGVDENSGSDVDEGVEHEADTSSQNQNENKLDGNSYNENDNEVDSSLDSIARNQGSAPSDSDHEVDEDNDFFPIGSVMPKPKSLKAEDELSGTFPYHLRVIIHTSSDFDSTQFPR